MSKLEEIYARYIKVMLYSANKVLGNMDLAEDAVQDAFAKFIKHPEYVCSIPIDDIKAYLIVVSENSARRLYYKQHKIPETPLDGLELFETGQEDASIAKLTIADIFRMPAFSPQFRDVIILRYYYDMTTKEIAKILDISESNARVRLTRAKSLLRQIIENGGAENGQAANG